ncbi:MAG: hypothetical protein ACFB0G_06555 [Leptolyngbyaceae cyanobacterium]
MSAEDREIVVDLPVRGDSGISHDETQIAFNPMPGDAIAPANRSSL